MRQTETVTSDIFYAELESRHVLALSPQARFIFSKVLLEPCRFFMTIASVSRLHTTKFPSKP